jgi:hypothetical protein
MDGLNKFSIAIIDFYIIGKTPSKKAPITGSVNRKASILRNPSR